MDIQCRYCDAELEADETYCGKTCPCPGCGKEIDIPDLNSPDSIPPPPTTLTKKPCPFCNEEILETSTRCTSCGKLLDATSTTTKGGIFRFLKIFKKK
jgi:predicted RNA-binding Zn-ribbon protein involved in translation (DUF1610 family)